MATPDKMDATRLDKAGDGFHLKINPGGELQSKKREVSAFTLFNNVAHPSFKS